MYQFHLIIIPRARCTSFRRSCTKLKDAHNNIQLQCNLKAVMLHQLFRVYIFFFSIYISSFSFQILFAVLLVYFFVFQLVKTSKYVKSLKTFLFKLIITLHTTSQIINTLLLWVPPLSFINMLMCRKLKKTLIHRKWKPKKNENKKSCLFCTCSSRHNSHEKRSDSFCSRNTETRFVLLFFSIFL